MFSLDALRLQTSTWQTSLSLALASDLAYQSFTVMQATTKAWGLSTFQRLDHADTQGFVAIAPDVTLIAFRGTQEPGDFLDDIDVLPTSRPYGRVHSGFLGAYNAIAGDLLATLRGLPATPTKIWLTGHSLGGAVASVAAAELAQIVTFAGIQTFGQPLLADSAMHDFFEQTYGGRFTRFVNNQDVVPRIPPGYQPVGHMVHFTADGGVERTALSAAIAEREAEPMSRPEYDRLKAEVRALKIRAMAQPMANRRAFVTSGLEFNFPIFLDHRIARYIDVLNRLAAGPA